MDFADNGITVYFDTVTKFYCERRLYNGFCC